MRRRAIFVLTMVIMLVASGCAYYRAPVQPPQGAFSTLEAPASTQFSEETPAGEKVGRSSAYSVLYLVAWGEAGADAAARNGDLSTINYIDYEYVSVLGLYTKLTTVAHGK